MVKLGSKYLPQGGGWFYRSSQFTNLAIGMAAVPAIVRNACRRISVQPDPPPTGGDCPDCN